MALLDEKYVMLTTFRKDGRPVGTAVWLVPFGDGQIGMYTGPETGKAKRLRHTSRVTLQPCDSKGKTVHGDVVEGEARFASDAELAVIAKAIDKRYGIMAPISRLVITVVSRLRGKKVSPGSLGVVVTLAPAASAA